MIDVQNLSKDYLLKRKKPGLGGAVKGLLRTEYETIHAVKDLSFHIDAGNIARYRFMKKELTAADIIADLSKIKPIKDVSIEEAGIDDIIRIAYGTK